jgi:hypothetical protein
MRDLIDVMGNAPYAQQEPGRHMAQRCAKHVQPDNLLRIICVVSIVLLENILNRSPVHA